MLERTWKLFKQVLDVGKGYVGEERKGRGFDIWIWNGRSAKLRQ